MREGVGLTVDGDVATITMNRPEKRNALTLGDLTALSAALDEAEVAPGLRALILTGAGGRAFSGGVDLGDVGAGGDAWDDNPLRALADRLERFSRPTIARINGAVIGGAAELSLACDFRVGAHGARLYVPATRIGIHYEPAGLRRAVSVLGLQGARRVYLLGEKMDDAALDRLGYFDRLTAPEALDDAVADILGLVRAGAPLAVDGLKRTLVEIAAGELDEDAARSRILASWSSEDLKEGLAAIQSGRAPVFTGR